MKKVKEHVDELKEECPILLRHDYSPACSHNSCCAFLALLIWSKVYEFWHKIIVKNRLLLTNLGAVIVFRTQQVRFQSLNALEITLVIHNHFVELVLNTFYQAPLFRISQLQLVKLKYYKVFSMRSLTSRQNRTLCHTPTRLFGTSSSI